MVILYQWLRSTVASFEIAIQVIPSQEQLTIRRSLNLARKKSLMRWWIF